jgi:hypothetical protein
MNKLRLLTASGAVLALVCGGLWFKFHPDNAGAPVVTIPKAVATTAPTAAAGGGTNAKDMAAPLPVAATTAEDRPAAASPAPTGPVLEDLLSSTSLSDKDVLSGLATIVLDAGRELSERSEAMSHLLNLSVENPRATLLPLIIDARLPDALCEQILDDALNSPTTWQADAYLAALEHRKNQAIQTKAREHLEFLTGADHGDNLSEWTKAVAAFKKSAAAE